MPDAAGQFKGISVPALPWQQEFAEGEIVYTVHGPEYGCVTGVDDDGTVWVLMGDEHDHYRPEELRHG